MCHMYELGWSHNKNNLMVDNVTLKSQTAHPPKSVDGRHTLLTGPMDFLIGPNSLC